MNTRILKSPCKRATLALDPSEIDRDDPGAGTPVMVQFQSSCGSYWCCSETGEIDGKPLPNEIVEWLNSDSVVAALDALGC